MSLVCFLGNPNAHLHLSSVFKTIFICWNILNSDVTVPVYKSSLQNVIPSDY